MLSSPPDQRLEVLLPLGEGLHREDLPPDAFDLLLRPAASGCERSDYVQMFRRDLVRHVYTPFDGDARSYPGTW